MAGLRAGADHRPGQLGVVAGVAEPLHERAVDLEDVDREPVQVAERGVAGAEVVDGQPRPQALELAQDRQDGLAVDHTVADQVPFTVTGPSCDSSDTTFFGVYLPATLDAGDRLYVGSAGAYTTPPTATGSRRRLRCSSAADDPAAPPDRDGAGRLVRAVAGLDGLQPARGPGPRPGRARLVQRGHADRGGPVGPGGDPPLGPAGRPGPAPGHLCDRVGAAGRHLRPPPRRGACPWSRP